MSINPEKKISLILKIGLFCNFQIRYVDQFQRRSRAMCTMFHQSVCERSPLEQQKMTLKLLVSRRALVSTRSAELALGLFQTFLSAITVQKLTRIKYLTLVQDAEGFRRVSTLQIKTRQITNVFYHCFVNTFAPIRWTKLILNVFCVICLKPSDLSTH